MQNDYTVNNNLILFILTNKKTQRAGKILIPCTKASQHDKRIKANYLKRFCFIFYVGLINNDG